MFVSAGRRLVRARRTRAGQESEIAPLVETEYCETMLPTSNVFAPASETDSEMGASGCTAFSKSAQRPPQPVTGGWSGMEVCHCVDLVGVGKKLRRLGQDAGLILGAGHGINQRAGVEQEGQLALAEQRLQFGAGRMQAVSVAVAVQ